MQPVLWMLKFKLQQWIPQEEGQDLVEYALIVALIALAATAGMNKLASAITNAFSNVASMLSTDV